MTVAGDVCTGVACNRIVVIAEVATVVPEILSCSVRLATDVTPAAGKKEDATYRLQLAVPLTVDRRVTLHAGKSTCSQETPGLVNTIASV